eukprot:TRINITY_DN2224_c0_g1_i1.p1 TRINITY_DN2224_c0_g1~~TRINITY_DN2224_c0_g1_i1.p1  ORF type:complete len:2744 (+),score=831.98 TRINITY_DN2224_c0_g1_i1:48-8279(+)
MGPPSPRAPPSPPRSLYLRGPRPANAAPRRVPRRPRGRRDKTPLPVQGDGVGGLRLSGAAMTAWRSVALAVGGRQWLSSQGDDGCSPEGRLSSSLYYCALGTADDSSGWVEVECGGALPPPRRQHAVVVVDRRLIVHGGLGAGGEILGDMYSLTLQPSRRRWVKVAQRVADASAPGSPQPPALRQHTLVDSTSLRAVLAFGGYTPQAPGVPSGRVWALDYETQSWRVVADGGRQFGRAGHSALSATLSGKEVMLVCGGVAETSPAPPLVGLHLASGEWSVLVSVAAPEGAPLLVVPSQRTLWSCGAGDGKALKLTFSPDSPDIRQVWQPVQPPQNAVGDGAAAAALLADLARGAEGDQPGAFVVQDATAACLWLGGGGSDDLWCFNTSGCGAVWAKAELRPEVALLPQLPRPSSNVSNRRQPDTRSPAVRMPAPPLEPPPPRCTVHLPPRRPPPAFVAAPMTSPRNSVATITSALLRRDLRVRERISGLNHRALSGLAGQGTHVLKKLLSKTLPGNLEKSRSLNLRGSGLTSNHYYLLSAVVSDHPSITHVDASNNPPVDDLGAQAVYQLLQANPHISKWDFTGTKVCNPHWARLIEQQLSSSAELSHDLQQQRRQRSLMKHRRQRLAEERRRREWEWARLSARRVCACSHSLGACEVEEQALRVSVDVQWHQHHLHVRAQRIAGRAAIERAEALRRRHATQRVDLASLEEVRRDGEAKEEERARAELRKADRDGRKKVDEKLRERTRRHKTERDHMTTLERDARAQVKTDMEEQHRLLRQEVDRWWQKYREELRRQQKEEEDARRAREQEERKRMVMEEQRRAAQVEWEKKRARARSDMVTDEFQGRQGVRGATDEAWRNLVGAEWDAMLAESRANEQQGNARRERARCNWIAPRLRITGPERVRAYYSNPAQPCCLLRGRTLEFDVTAPQHLVDGQRFPDDPETVVEWTERKKQVLGGAFSFLVDVNHSSYAPGIRMLLAPAEDGLPGGKGGDVCVHVNEAGELCWGTFEEYYNDGDEEEGEAGEPVFVGEPIATVTKQLTPAEAWCALNPGMDVSDAPEELAESEEVVGMELELAGPTPESLLNTILHSFAIRIEATSGTSFPLLLRTDLEFVSAEEGRGDTSAVRREFPGSLDGGSLRAEASTSFMVAAVPTPITLPEVSATVTFTEGDGEVRLLRGAHVNAATDSLVGATLSIAIQNAGVDDSIVFRSVQRPERSLQFQGANLIHTMQEAAAASPGRRALSFSSVDLSAPESPTSEVCYSGLSGDPPWHFHCATLVRRGRLRIEGEKSSDGDPQQSIQIRLEKDITVQLLRDMLNMLYFANDSADPEERTRRVLVLLTEATGVQSQLFVDVDVIAQDNPTIIDFGMSVSYWRVQTGDVPPALREYVEPQPQLAVGAAGTFSDPDTTTISSGWMEVAIVQGLCRGDSLTLNCPTLAQALNPAPSGDKDQEASEPVAPPMIVTDGNSILCYDASQQDPDAVEPKYALLGTRGPLSESRGSADDAPREGFRVDFVQDGFASIERAELIFKRLTFCIDISDPRRGPKLDTTRCIEVVLQHEDTDPVGAKLLVKVTPPLFVVPPSSALTSFREDAEPQRIAPFDVLGEKGECDDGWDGGHLTVEILDGFVRGEDCVILQEDEKERVRLGPEKVKGENGKWYNPEDLKGARDTSPGPAEQEQADLENEQFRVESPPVNDDAGQQPRQKRDTKSVRDLLRERIRFEARQNLEERRMQELALRSRIMRQVRQGPKAPEPSKVRDLIVNEQVIGLLITQVNGMMVVFHQSKALKKAMAEDHLHATASRAELCQTHRKEVLAVMRCIRYQNISQDPHVLRKILRFVGNDGMPHCTHAYVEINVQPTDDATEIRRLSWDPLDYRQGSMKDVIGFALFDDCSLFDPDSHAFNGGYLVVELVSGGDPQGDQLGFMTISDQRNKYLMEEQALKRERTQIEKAQQLTFEALKGKGLSSGSSKATSEQVESPRAPLSPQFYQRRTSLIDKLQGSRRLEAIEKEEQRCYIHRDESNRLFYESPSEGYDMFYIGDLIVDDGAGTATTFHSTMRITFKGFAAGVDRPTSPETAMQEPDTVFLHMVETALHCITYTNVARKVKPNVTTYLLRVNAGDAGPDGRAKIALDVKGPLIWSPDFAREVKWTRGKGPIVINSKVLTDLEKNCTDGFLTCRITEGASPGDVVALALEDSGYHYKPGQDCKELYKAGEFLGRLTESTPHSLRIEWNWASKLTGRTLGPLFKLLTFDCTADRPAVTDRQIQISFSTNMWDPGSFVETRISVLDFDDMTEVLLNTPAVVEYSLCSGIKNLAPKAEVTDNDTEYFDPPSFLSAEFLSASSPTDLLSLHDPTGVLYLGDEVPSPGVASPSVRRQRADDGKPSPSKTTPVQVEIKRVEKGIKATPAMLLSPTSGMKTVVQRALKEQEVMMAAPPRRRCVGRLRKTPSGFTVVLECSIADLQYMVRCVSFSSTSMRERSAKRVVQVIVKGGDAPPTKVTQNLELMPALIDLTSCVTQSFKGLKQLELFSLAKLNKAEYPGATLEIRTWQSSLRPTSPLQMKAVSSVNFNSSVPPASPSPASESAGEEEAERTNTGVAARRHQSIAPLEPDAETTLSGLSTTSPLQDPPTLPLVLSQRSQVTLQYDEGESGPATVMLEGKTNMGRFLEDGSQGSLVWQITSNKQAAAAQNVLKVLRAICAVQTTESKGFFKASKSPEKKPTLSVTFTDPASGVAQNVPMSVT